LLVEARGSIPGSFTTEDAGQSHKLWPVLLSIGSVAGPLFSDHDESFLVASPHGAQGRCVVAWLRDGMIYDYVAERSETL
jgi:hypothetical protein